MYVTLALLYLPTLHFAPVSLDDRSLLSDFGARPFTSILNYDRFGHLRPLKNLGFWFLGHHPEWLVVIRLIVLGTFIASVALIQRLASKLIGSPAWGILAAACWAYNPVPASVVPWLSASNLVVCLFGLVVFASFVDRALGTAGARQTRGGNLVGAFAGLSLAALSHEIGLVAPALLLLYPGAIRDRRAAPLAAVGVMCTLMVVALRVLGTPPSTSYRFDQYPAWLLVLSSARYVFENLSLWFWSAGRFGVLFVDRPYDRVAMSVVCWAVLIVGGLAFWRLGRWSRGLTFGVFWAALFLLPVVNLVPLANTPVALHYLYIPSVGLAVIAGQAMHDLRQRMLRSASRYAWAPVAGLIAVIVLWLPERQRSMHAWNDDIALYAETVANYPANIEARVNLASTYMTRKRYSEAAALLEESMQRAPQDVVLVRSYFDVLLNSGRAVEALALGERHENALNTPEYLLKRGTILEQLGRHEDAAVFLRRAFDQAENPELRLAAGSQLAIALMRTHRTSEAAALVNRLLAEHPHRRELLLAKELLAVP